MCSANVPEEFALRMAARPGDKLYCRLSVNVQSGPGEAHHEISKNSFRPPPQVESSVVRVEPRNQVCKFPFRMDGMIRILFGEE